MIIVQTLEPGFAVLSNWRITLDILAAAMVNILGLIRIVASAVTSLLMKEIMISVARIQPQHQ